MQTQLDTGMIQEQVDSGVPRQHEYRMILMGEEHMPQIMALQERIVISLNRPDLFEPLSYEAMKVHVKRRGFILGVLVDHLLVGFRVVYFPHSREKEWNLGLDIGLREDQQSKIANLQMACVHPGFRGNALALRMNRIAIKLLRKQEVYEHVFATVSPFNVWNVRILLNCGFRIAMLKIKYGGKLRYIVYQNLRAPMAFTDEEAVYAPLDDLDTQVEFFQSGHYGVALAQKQEISGDREKNLIRHSHVIFKRPAHQQIVHVVKRRPQAAESNLAIDAGPWMLEASPTVKWHIAGDRSVSAFVTSSAGGQHAVRKNTSPENK